MMVLVSASDPAGSERAWRPRRVALGWRILAIALIAASLLLLTRALGETGWSGVMVRLAQTRPDFLALAVLTCLAAYTMWAVRWIQVLRPVARVPWWPAQKALMASIFVNTVVPFARSLGGLVRATALARSTGVPAGTLYGPTLLDQIGYSTVGLCLGALTIPAASWDRGPGAGRGWLFVCLGAAAIAGAFLLMRNRRAWLMARLRGRLPGAAASVEQSMRAARRTALRPSTWIIMAAGGSAVWLLNVLTFLVAARATGANVGFSAAAAAWSIGSMAGVASGTPGGVGTTETAAVVPLIALGIPPQDAIASILLARLIQYATALTIGGACFLASGTSVRDSRQRLGAQVAGVAPETSFPDGDSEVQATVCGPTPPHEPT